MISGMFFWQKRIFGYGSGYNGNDNYEFVIKFFGSSDKVMGNFEFKILNHSIHLIKKITVQDNMRLFSRFEL